MNARNWLWCSSVRGTRVRGTLRTQRGTCRTLKQVWTATWTRRRRRKRLLLWRRVRVRWCFIPVLQWRRCGSFNAQHLCFGSDPVPLHGVHRRRPWRQHHQSGLRYHLGTQWFRNGATLAGSHWREDMLRCRRDGALHVLRTRRGGDQESRGETLVLIVLNASNRGLNIYTIVQLFNASERRLCCSHRLKNTVAIMKYY